MPAHAAYAWVQTHLRKPFAVPIGTVKRRGKSGSSVVSDFLTLRKTIFLCASCEAKMPYAWRRRWEYRILRELRSTGTRCDHCQLVGQTTNIFVAEDGGYYQEAQHHQKIREQAAAQQVLVRDKRRIPGTERSI